MDKIVVDKPDEWFLYCLTAEARLEIKSEVVIKDIT